MNNEREVLHLLTEAGTAAYLGHQAFHKTMISDLMTFLGNIPIEQFETLDNLVASITLFFDKYVEETLPTYMPRNESRKP